MFSLLKWQASEAASETACSYAAAVTRPGSGLSNTRRRRRSSSRVNSRTLSWPVLAVAFQSTNRPGPAVWLHECGRAPYRGHG